MFSNLSKGKMSVKKVVVFGGNGFVGSAILRKLVERGVPPPALKLEGLWNSGGHDLPHPSAEMIMARS